MTDLTSRINNIIDESSEKAAKIVSTYGKPKYIAALIEIVISAIAITGIQIVAMGFDFSKLAEWQFWTKIAALTACIFLLYRGVINARFETTANRKEVLVVKDEYASLTNEKDLDMKQFLEEYNLKNKIKAYVSKINKRINRLERKRIKTLDLAKKERLKAKVNILKQEIDQDRIKEIIDVVRVKYYMVWYDDFENIEKIGSNGQVITRGYQAYNKAFNIASFNKMWIYILCSVILSISIWTFGDTSTITIIANVLSSAIMIVTRVLTALVEADRLYDSTITAAFVSKIEILKEYFKWRNDKVDEQIKKADVKPIDTQEQKPFKFNGNKIEVA